MEPMKIYYQDGRYRSVEFLISLKQFMGNIDPKYPAQLRKALGESYPPPVDELPPQAAWYYTNGSDDERTPRIFVENKLLMDMWF